MDIFGPLTVTRRNNRFVVVFVDHFSKWPELVPCSTITAEVIAAILHNRLVCRFGCPRTLLTDRGPQFVASITRRLCERYGIRKVFTSAYHPQGDPVAEAFMKTLARSLSCLTQQYPAQWDELCDSVACAYRTSVHPATGETPFYMTYGRDAVLPQDLTILTPDTPTSETVAPRLAVSAKCAKRPVLPSSWRRTAPRRTMTRGKDTSHSHLAP